LLQSVREPVVLKNVVLSDFSRGRQLMYSVRTRAKGLEPYLREIWDFDGKGGAPPYSTGKVRGIIYDQEFGNDPRSYHVPAPRWSRYHEKVVDPHGLIPNMLMWHAGEQSSVGK